MYSKKLLLITSDGDPKNQELRSTVKHAMEMLPAGVTVEFKEVNVAKHPNIGKKLGLKMQAQNEIKDQKIVESDPLLILPSLVYLENDVPVFQRSGIIRPEMLAAVMTGKPIYAHPGDDVVPVNLF
jgi:hypothetical protein